MLWRRATWRVVDDGIVVCERCVDRQKADSVGIGPAVGRKLLPAAIIALPAATGHEKRKKCRYNNIGE